MLDTEHGRAMSIDAPRFDPGNLPAADAASLLRNLRGARSLLRAVVLAEAAHEDGSVGWPPGNSSPARWFPVMGQVRDLLDDVRSIVIGTTGNVPVDWPVILNLAEALDAALWHTVSAHENECLESAELVSAMEVLIALIDRDLMACADAGVCAHAQVHSAAGLSPIGDGH